MRSQLLAIPVVLAAAAFTLASPLLQAEPAAKAGEAAQTPAVLPSHSLRLHNEMRKVMDDMAQEVDGMQEQMGKGELPPEARNGMVSSMKKMSVMMHRMSDLLHHPSMNEPRARKQLETMRKQMDEMKKAPKMSEPAGPHPATTTPGSGAARSLRAEYEMARLLQDMANEMRRMQDQVNFGKLTPKIRNEIASSMEQMSDMMRRLSGLTARSAMKDADMRRQLEKMQAQMAHMRDSPEMSGAVKPLDR
jgi:hypothetical protein